MSSTATTETTCQFPECDRFRRDGDTEIYCEFHHLARQQRLGEPITDEQLERAFFAD